MSDTIRLKYCLRSSPPIPLSSLDTTLVNEMHRECRVLIHRVANCEDLLRQLHNDILANDYNEHWDSYKNLDEFVKNL